MLPCSLNLKLQPAVLSPRRPVASLLPYFAFFKFFSFMRLRTLPSSVSRKSFACHSYENGQGVYQQFPIWNAPRPCRGTRPCRNPSILHFRLCELCVLSRLPVNSGFSSLATVHGSPATFAYPLSFHILADSFALTQNSTLLFSSNSKLFAQNTRGGVYIPLAGACEPAGASLFQRFLFQLSTVDCQPPPCRSSHVSRICYSGRPRMRDNPSWRLRNATRKRKPTP